MNEDDVWMYLESNEYADMEIEELKQEIKDLKAEIKELTAQLAEAERRNTNE